MEIIGFIATVFGSIVFTVWGLFIVMVATLIPYNGKYFLLLIPYLGICYFLWSCVFAHISYV